MKNLSDNVKLMILDLKKYFGETTAAATVEI